MTHDHSEQVWNDQIKISFYILLARQAAARWAQLSPTTIGIVYHFIAAGVNKADDVSLSISFVVYPRMLKRIVGHSNVGITNAVYIHMYVDDLREAMEKVN